MPRDSGLTDQQAFWLEHLRACGSTSLKSYAEAQGLEVRALYDAKARLRRQGLVAPASARFVRLERSGGYSTTSGYCRVHLRNGTAVDVACTPQQWSALLASVAVLP
jgi:hypothetical protein